jgi:hypothetical protein
MTSPTMKTTHPIGTVSKIKYANAPAAQFGMTVHSGVMRTAIAETIIGARAKIGATHIRTTAAFERLFADLLVMLPLTK